MRSVRGPHPPLLLLLALLGCGLHLVAVVAHRGHVVVHVDPDYLWGTVNNNLRYVPLELGSVVKFHRNRVVDVHPSSTGVTTFEAEICQACQDCLNAEAPVCQDCHADVLGLNAA